MKSSNCAVWVGLVAGAGLLGAAAAPSLGASVAATWQFNNSFAADEAGAPALTAVDPLGTSGFHSDTVFGETRTVWAFNGGSSPASQAGLTVGTVGLVDPQNYSVYMIVELTERSGAWRRLLDVQNRQSDSGFYVDPSNNLDVYPVSGSSAAWTDNEYHGVVLTVSGSAVNAYLDGVSQFTTTTSIMDLDADPANNPNRVLGFFLDNVVGGGQGEWSAGNVALAQLWDGALLAADAQALASHPFPAAVPVPAAAPAGLGLVALLGAMRSRKRRAH